MSSSVQCWFTSTETIGTIRDGKPRTSTSTFTQLLSSDTMSLQCCCTSTETIRLIRDGGAQDGHLDFHTTPELRKHAKSISTPHPHVLWYAEQVCTDGEASGVLRGKMYRVSLDLLANHLITNSHLATSEPMSLVINLSPQWWRAVNAELKVTSAQNPDSMILNVRRNRRDY